MMETQQNSNDQVMDILFTGDEITWQSLIYELVSNEKMDPWDIDVSKLAAMFLDKLKKIKEMDLKVSGKVLLAAAIMIRVKSYRFMAEDINALDTLFASANQPEEDEFFDDLLEYDGEEGAINLENKPNIYPRTPQPRKRKVSVFDLVNALEKALSVYKRRPPKIKEKLAKLRAPEKGRDISVVIKEMHARVTKHFSNVKSKKNKLNFTHLLNDDSKEEKVYTFIPLLYLDNQRKIDLTQQYHFGDIFINMVDQKKLKIEKAVVDE